MLTISESTDQLFECGLNFRSAVCCGTQGPRRYARVTNSIRSRCQAVSDTSVSGLTCCGTEDARLVPRESCTAVSDVLFDHLVSACEQRWWHREADNDPGPGVLGLAACLATAYQ